MEHVPTSLLDFVKRSYSRLAYCVTAGSLVVCHRELFSHCIRMCTRVMLHSFVFPPVSTHVEWSSICSRTILNKQLQLLSLFLIVMMKVSFIFFQLCVAICNFLLEVLSAGRVQDSEELFSHKLPETSIKHFTLFLTKSVLVDIDSDSSVGKDRHDLVKAVQDSLKKVVDCGDDIGTGLATVWNVFVKSFEKMDRGI